MKRLGNALRIEYLKTALSDLDNITDYYFALFGIESAMKVYDQIRASVGQLDEYPGSGVPCKDRQLKNLGYRELFSGRFVIVYRVDEGEQKLYINHIADTQTDYPHLYKNL